MVPLPILPCCGILRTWLGVWIFFGHVMLQVCGGNYVHADVLDSVSGSILRCKWITTFAVVLMYCSSVAGIALLP